MSKFVFFFGKTNVFSQFYPCTFVVDEKTYCCAEQYMHEQKALLFGDHKIAKQIMETSDPVTMKRLGRQVANFDESVWENESKKIVTSGNIAKFLQNSDLKSKLFATYPKILAEANPNDRIWGIGLSSDDPRAKNEKTWRGENRLGYILMTVRLAMLRK